MAGNPLLTALPEVQQCTNVQGDFILCFLGQTNRYFTPRGSPSQIPIGSISFAREINANGGAHISGLTPVNWIALIISIGTPEGEANALQVVHAAITVQGIVSGRFENIVYILVAFQEDNWFCRQLLLIEQPQPMTPFLINQSEPNIIPLGDRVCGTSELVGGRIYIYLTNKDNPFGRTNSSRTFYTRRGVVRDRVIIDESTALIAKQSTLNDQQVANAINELSVLIELRDAPNIIDLIDYYRDNDHIYAILPQYNRNGEDIINELDHGRIRAFIMQVTKGVLAAHRREIVIRNLTLQHILLVSAETNDRKYVISELDACIKFPRGYLMRFDTMIPGEGPFRPPETNTSDFGFYDPYKGDAWAIGVMLIALLIRRLPFPNTNYIASNDNFRILVSIHGVNGLVMSLCGELFNERLMNLLRGLLQVDPRYRLSVEEILQQSWFN